MSIAMRVIFNWVSKVNHRLLSGSTTLKFGFNLKSLATFSAIRGKGKSNYCKLHELFRALAASFAYPCLIIITLCSLRCYAPVGRMGN